ncbi:DUF1003 domain-containing protein [Sediminicoccus sp. KRV36]|uniref:DUF1003 domain-containing protein n=1 Tax=Sediminicoccus sp. KRV36 TaxID=3133721 RepID=UPI00200CC350|nr:DUF1003 domain-containing protein [Sediminicoccus rosea]UPY36628.1 DUF1003 domain-containing protein [Sediminicoccus rosea]
MPRFQITPEEQATLLALRAERPARSVAAMPPGTGQRVADAVARIVGSWRFILIQSTLLAIWIGLNITAVIARWDPYPFILLNLVLSFQAAYTAPIIMMSQNRASEVDRRNAESDYRINVKAELEIEALHAKIDALREQDILKMLGIIERLVEIRSG